MLLAGGEPPSGNLARAEVLPPIAEAVAEWRLTAATTTSTIDLGKYWRRYTMDDHNIQGRAIVPGAGWLALIAHEAGTSKLADVAFMRGVFEPDTTIRVVKRRRLMQATAGEETILKASLVSGDAAPETIGPDVFGRGVALGSPSKKKPARGKENGVEENSVADNGVEQSDASRNKNAEAVGVKITDDSNHEQHYRRCSALRLEYGGAYRAIERVARRARTGSGMGSPRVREPLRRRSLREASATWCPATDLAPCVTFSRPCLSTLRIGPYP